MDLNSELESLSRTDRDKMKFGVNYRIIQAQCEGPDCETTIEQPDRPGRKRRFCTDRCRQAAHRARKKTPTPEYLAWVKSLQQL